MKQLWILLLVAACTGRLPPLAQEPPASVVLVRTTDARVAMGNLEASIASAKRRLERDSEDEKALQKLARGLLRRGMVLQSERDLEAALALANVSAARRPGLAERLLRARCRIALHQFDAAAEDVELAALLEPTHPEIPELRATLYRASQRHQEALGALLALNQRAPSPVSLAMEGSVRSELGEAEKADALFVDALKAMRDPSPFAVAWLEVERGAALERAGRTSAARAHYASALHRLPQYVEAGRRLARLRLQERLAGR